MKPLTYKQLSQILQRNLASGQDLPIVILDAQTNQEKKLVCAIPESELSSYAIHPESEVYFLITATEDDRILS